MYVDGYHYKTQTLPDNPITQTFVIVYNDNNEGRVISKKYLRKQFKSKHKNLLKKKKIKR